MSPRQGDTAPSDRRKPVKPPPPVFPVTVLLTAREMEALAGPPAATFVITSADDEHHRVNYAHSALVKFQHAVRDQRQA